MSDETGTSCEVATCGVSISADRAQVSIYLGGVETDKSFEFTIPKDLAVHMASTIQKLANPAGARSTAKRGGRT